jgi:hypothetical protein
MRSPCFTVWPSWQSRKPLARCQFGGVFGAAPGADVAVASLREEER